MGGYQKLVPGPFQRGTPQPERGEARTGIPPLPPARTGYTAAGMSLAVSRRTFFFIHCKRKSMQIYQVGHKISIQYWYTIFQTCLRNTKSQPNSRSHRFTVSQLFRSLPGIIPLECTHPLMEGMVVSLHALLRPFKLAG